MSRFLLVLHDAGGTVPPMVAIADELVGRGHEVVVLGQPCIEPRAVAAGATFEAFRSLDDYDHSVPLEEQLDRSLAAIVGTGVGDDLLAAVERHSIDAVVVDCNLAGAAAAAESCAVPSAVLLHSLHRTYVDVWFGELWPLLAAGINDARAHFGLAPVGSWTELFAVHERAYSVVPEAFDAPTIPLANLRYLGWTVPKAPTASVPSGRPVILVSLSTTRMSDHDLIQAALDGLGMLSVRGIATIADRVGHGRMTVPANVSVHEAVPHAALLPNIAAVVTHAGLGTVAASLSHGVPLVCTPIDRDQPLNAQRVVALGAGVLVDRPTGADIAVAVQRVIDNSEYRAAAEAIAGTSGAEAAADDLELLVSQR